MPKMGQNAPLQKNEINRRYKRRRLFFFACIKTPFKTKRPGFVPDRYLQKPTVVVAEEFRKWGNHLLTRWLSP
jgi:hypothetical protein